MQNFQPSFYTDSHTHLLDYDRQSHISLQQILAESSNSSIKYITCNTCCSNEFKEMENVYLKQLEINSKKIELKEQCVNVVPCFGVHPCYVCEEVRRQNEGNQKDSWQKELKEYLTKYPQAQVGEIGLDFRKDVMQSNPQQLQWQYFEYQFTLALQLKRSVTIHCVRAYSQLLKYFKKLNSSLKQPSIPIILHSYGGSSDISKSLMKLQNLQIYFSLSLKHSKSVLQVVPVERILIETDAPYQNDREIVIRHQLATKEKFDHEDKFYGEYKGTNESLLKQCKFFNKSVLDNRPKYVIANYREIAKAYKLDQATLCIKISQNFMKAFKLIK